MKLSMNETHEGLGIELGFRVLGSVCALPLLDPLGSVDYESRRLAIGRRFAAQLVPGWKRQGCDQILAR